MELKEGGGLCVDFTVRKNSDSRAYVVRQYLSEFFACGCVSVPPPVRLGFFPMTSPLKHGAHSWTEIPLPRVFITSLLDSHLCQPAHTQKHTHTHGHMLSSWVPVELPGNQGAPIIAVHYSSHFPDGHIKQPSTPFDPPGSGQCDHRDLLSLRYMCECVWWG